MMPGEGKFGNCRVACCSLSLRLASSVEPEVAAAESLLWETFVLGSGFGGGGWEAVEGLLAACVEDGLVSLMWPWGGWWVEVCGLADIVEKKGGKKGRNRFCGR